MTKKEFLTQIDYHVYGRRRDNSFKAVFFDHTKDGYKYCVYARAGNATKKELVDELYDIITNKSEQTSWWIDLVIAQTDEQRFKVPIVASGLNKLIKTVS